jgi:hypothetical protein
VYTQHSLAISHRTTDTVLVVNLFRFTSKRYKILSALWGLSSRNGDVAVGRTRGRPLENHDGVPHGGPLAGRHGAAREREPEAGEQHVLPAVGLAAERGVGHPEHASALLSHEPGVPLAQLHLRVDPPGEQLQEHHAEGVDVPLGVGPQVLEALGCLVRRRRRGRRRRPAWARAGSRHLGQVWQAARRLHGPLAPEQPRRRAGAVHRGLAREQPVQAQVADPGLHVGAQQDVARFQVAVHALLLVDEHQTARHATRDPQPRLQAQVQRRRRPEPPCTTMTISGKIVII